MNFLFPLIVSLTLHSSPQIDLSPAKIKEILSPKHCEKIFEQVEKEHGILPKLLQAVARVESGKWDPDTKKSAAWPWTITVKGKGQYFQTKEEAIQEIKRLKRAGIHDFDVGLMQINNYWHKDAFSSPEEALDPETNIRYGAKFLKELFDRYKSWTKAIGCYHSHSPKHKHAYCNRVLTALGKEKQAFYQEYIQKTKKQYRKKHRRKYRRYL